MVGYATGDTYVKDSAPLSKELSEKLMGYNLCSLDSIFRMFGDMTIADTAVTSMEGKER